MVGLYLGQPQEIVTVAGQEDVAASVSELEHSLIGRFFGKAMPQEHYLIAKPLEQVPQILWNVLIEQKLHSDACAICPATSTSISPRWSS